MNAGTWGAIAVAVAAVGIGGPFFQDAFIVSHDYINNLLKHLSMRHYFGQGQLLPVWVPDYYYGYGGAIFNFYPPLFFLVSALLDLLGFSPALAINLTCFLSVLGSGLAMYACLKHLAGVFAGVLGAVVYMAAPYHVADLYIRGSYAEAMAFVFLPLIFWGLARGAERGTGRAAALTALATAGLLLSHNGTSLIFMPFAVLYVCFLAAGARSVPVAVGGMASLLWGAGLSAFFWLPALAEKQYLDLDRFTGGLLNYRLHLLHPVQLFFSPAQYGEHTFLLRMSFQLGWVLSGIVLAGTLCVMLWAARPLKRQFLFFLGSAMAALGLTTIYARGIWDAFPLLSMVQFPWRFLTLASFFLALLAGGVGVIPYRRWLVVAGGLLLLVFLLGRLGDCRAAAYDVRTEAAAPEAMRVINPAGVEWDYVPAVVRQPLRERPLRPLEFPAGDAEVLSYGRLSPIKHRFLVLSRTQARARFNQYVFPGWRVEVDGQPVRLIDDQQGLLAFALPPGRHEVQVSFEPTPVRRIGMTLSALCWLGLLGVAVHNRRENMPRPVKIS